MVLRSQWMCDCLQFAGIETIMTAVVDAVPLLRNKKFLVAPCICAILYLLGLTMCTRVG